MVHLKSWGMFLLRALAPNRMFSFISHDVALDAVSTLENFPLAALAPGWRYV